MTKYVKTDYDGCEYITAGKWYEVTRSTEDGGYIVDDVGDEFDIIFERSQTIGYNAWTVSDTNPLTIEAGKYYRTRDGRKVGPMKKYNTTVWHYDGSKGTFYDDGASWSGYDEDLIAEWQDEDHTTGTLAELDVKSGDVVEHQYGSTYTVMDDMCLKSHQSGDRIDYRDCWDTCDKFRIISRSEQATTDTPTLWRDMTPEEKGKLLLAKHEGRGVEEMVMKPTTPLDVSGQWMQWTPTTFHDAYAYRIAPPKPVVETVDMYANKKMKGFGLVRGPKSTHRITFNTIDGVPDCGSVKMVPVT